MAGELNCRHCGRRFPAAPGADLYCSDECSKAHPVETAIGAELLRKAGFSPVDGVHGLWEKGGVHVTADQVKHEGIHKALDAHSETLADRS